MTLQFVNYRGEPLSPPPLRSLRQERKEQLVINSFHKGWRVQGIPPDALEKARHRHLMLMSDNREPKPFSERNGCAMQLESRSAPSPTRFLMPRKPAQN